MLRYNNSFTFGPKKFFYIAFNFSCLLSFNRKQALFVFQTGQSFPLLVLAHNNTIFIHIFFFFRALLDTSVGDLSASIWFVCLKIGPVIWDFSLTLGPNGIAATLYQASHHLLVCLLPCKGELGRALATYTEKRVW